MSNEPSPPYVRQAVRAQLPVPLPLGQVGYHGYLRAVDTVIGYLCTGMLLPARPIYRGTHRNTLQLIRCSPQVFLHRMRKTERGSSTMDENRCPHVAVFREIGYNTLHGAFQAALYHYRSRSDQMKEVVYAIAIGVRSCWSRYECPELVFENDDIY